MKDPADESLAEHSVRFYDSIAERFATWSESSPYNAYYERPALRALVGDVAGLDALDAGCAAGSHAEWLARSGASSVVAVDHSPKMVELARSRLADLAVAVHLADLGEPMTFLADGSFDLVISSLVLDEMPDWGVPLGEFRRLLRPSGRLVISVEHPMTSWEMFGRGSYFDVEVVEWPWRAIGAEIPSRFARRPLHAMTEALAGAAFLIERLIEPLPLPELADRDPEEFAELTQRPSFLLFRCLPV